MSAAITAIVIVFALLVGGIGSFLLTEATTGVGIIAMGCLIAIIGRIIQAEVQTDNLKGLLSPQQAAPHKWKQTAPILKDYRCPGCDAWLIEKVERCPHCEYFFGNE